jgi:hypothetical protein
MPAVSNPDIRCMDARCLNFQQQVARNHQHWYRDTDAACLNFQQYVAPNHRHVYRNRDVTSPQFLQYAPDRKGRRRR